MIGGDNVATSKRGTTPTFAVTLPVVLANVSTIEFLFKQYNRETADIVVEKTYPADVSYDVESSKFIISFTLEESYKFEANKSFFMDTRINYTSGQIPKTNIVEITMNNTLFAEE